MCTPEMAPFYEKLCEQLKWPVDQALLQQTRTANTEQINKFAAQMEDAEKNLGETEIRDILLAKAEYLCKIGEKVCCRPSYFSGLLIVYLRKKRW